MIRQNSSQFKALEKIFPKNRLIQLSENKNVVSIVTTKLEEHHIIQMEKLGWKLSQITDDAHIEHHISAIFRKIDDESAELLRIKNRLLRILFAEMIDVEIKNNKIIARLDGICYNPEDVQLMKEEGFDYDEKHSTDICPVFVRDLQ